MQAHMFDTEKRARTFADKKNKTAHKFRWIVVKSGSGWVAYGRRKR